MRLFKRNRVISAQQSIPLDKMYRDGIAATNGRYSRTVVFYDTNYILSKDEDRRALFEEWCSFLNSFDDSVSFELTFVNSRTRLEKDGSYIEIPNRNDGFDNVRKEYSGMLKERFLKGDRGITKRKYLTFSISAENVKEARLRLDGLTSDILSAFERMGVKAGALNGYERLRVLHDIFHLREEDDPFLFDWKDLVTSGLTVKDYVSPTSFSFSKSRSFSSGRTVGAMSHLFIAASELSDEFLHALLDSDSPQVLSIHVRPVNQAEAIKSVKHKITELDRSKIDEQKKAVRAGYDMDIIPSDLATYSKEAKEYLHELQNRNERMFMMSILVMNTGRNARELEMNVFKTQSVALQQNCALRRLDFRQEDALMSVLPLANNLIRIKRSMPTSALASFIPFYSQELFLKSKDSLYYGLNAMDDSLIMADRKALKNPNGLILGTPGSGKSFAAKREIADLILKTHDDVIICDPEDEYALLVERFNGQVISISPSGSQYVNPMDINERYADEDNPVALKADFILSLCELIIGGKEGLQPVEKTVIDRCVHKIYQRYFEDPRPDRMPVLEDLYDELLLQDEKEARHVAAALEIYVKGSLNLFNHRTNVDIKNRLVCYDIKALGTQLKKLGMLIVQDQVWGRVTKNSDEGRTTRYYMDEFHLLLKEEQTAAYSSEIWKRFRKWGGIPTGITQNVKDLLESARIENIFENSDFILMLNQGQRDSAILAEKLNISARQLSYVRQAKEGQGLLFFGDVILPFTDSFPKDTELYRIMTTKASEKWDENKEAKES
ncbi:MAG: DUF87 domain-containing protein [Lachnospiraceae bacterium]|nr:DUF87 domain-containing protein [Lachnospiraceae bacterium]